MLYLRYSELTTLPNFIAEMKSLRDLYLGGNNFSRAEQNRIRRLLPWCRVHF